MSNLHNACLQLPALGSTDGQDDRLVPVRLFTPMSSFTWYLYEYDPQDKLAFGLVTSHIVPEGEFGYVSIEELEALRGPKPFQMLPAVEVDTYYIPTTLDKIQDEIKANTF